MNLRHARTLVTSLLCTGLLASSGLALADDRGRWSRDWDDRRDHRHHKHQRHYRDHERTVIRERVIIREQPRYIREREGLTHYYTPPRYYSAPAPAIVIGVNIPPLVIPLR